MAQDTFKTLWNRLLLYSPKLPPYLAQEFIKNTHRRIVDHHYWSELKQDAELFIPAPYTTGTVAWTQDGTTITGTGTTFTSAMTNRQIQLNNLGNIYTVTYSSATELTTDRAIKEATDTGVSYTLKNWYHDLPTDFEVPEVFRDRSNAWRIQSQFYSQEYLDRIDPNRTSTGTPTIMAYASNRTDGSGNQIPRMELWPSPNAAYDVDYRYRKTSTLSAATDRGIEMVGPDCYNWGALAELALWPGTPDSPNPFFRVDLHKEYENKFQERLNDAVVGDNDRDQRMVQYGMGEERSVPIDASYIQSHGL